MNTSAGANVSPTSRIDATRVVPVQNPVTLLPNGAARVTFYYTEGATRLVEGGRQKFIASRLTQRSEIHPTEEAARVRAQELGLVQDLGAAVRVAGNPQGEVGKALVRALSKQAEAQE